MKIIKVFQHLEVVIGISLINVIVSRAIIALFLFVILRLLKMKDEIEAPPWLTGQLTGAIETFIFTIAVALNLSGVVPAMVAWTAIKAQMHWNVFSHQGNVARGYVALLAGFLSMGLALIGGFIAGNIAGTWH